jgi:hypothetical protein
MVLDNCNIYDYNHDMEIYNDVHTLTVYHKYDYIHQIYSVQLKMKFPKKLNAVVIAECFWQTEIIIPGC